MEPPTVSYVRPPKCSAFSLSRRRVEQFYLSVAGCLELGVPPAIAAHQRGSREDVMAFVKFMEIDWPDRRRAAARLK